jgi:AcrR family transcriptional regulator
MHARLLRGAHAAFEERGYSDTTVDDIVVRADASRATFYLHFGGKLEALQELIRRLADEAVELFRALGELEGPTRESLAAWLSDTFDWYRTNRALIRANYQAAELEADHSGIHQEDFNRLVDAMSGPIARWHDLAPEQARLRAMLLAVQHQRFCYLWIVQGWRFDEETVLNAMTDLWWHALGYEA